MSALEIVYRDPRSLVGYEANARTHSPEQIEQIRASIREFSFTNPILLRDDGKSIGAGHGRCEAAIAEGLEQVPTIIIPGLTEQQWRAYILADNRLALNAGWDEALLAAELTILKDAEYDLSLTGFDESDLARLFATKGETDPDEVPDPPEVPVTLPGDVWLLGDHRLVCGSSTEQADVAKALNGERPHLMVTDPPYGVEYDASWRESAHNADGSRLSIGNHAKGKVQNDGQADWREAWELFPGDVAYVWHAGIRAGPVQESLEAVGLVIRAQIIWAKQIHIIGRGDYHPKHEPCFYAVRKGKRGHWEGGRKQNTVWDDIPNMHRTQGSTDDMRTTHSTQKPLTCMRRPIENNSKAGDRVYEPFSGSGTTIIACEMTGRKCHAIELDPRYIDCALERWQTFVGGEAVLESSGQTFAQVKEERANEAGHHRVAVLGADAR